MGHFRLLYCAFFFFQQLDWLQDTLVRSSEYLKFKFRLYKTKPLPATLLKCISAHVTKFYYCTILKKKQEIKWQHPQISFSKQDPIFKQKKKYIKLIFCCLLHTKILISTNVLFIKLLQTILQIILQMKVQPGLK